MAEVVAIVATTLLCVAQLIERVVAQRDWNAKERSLLNQVLAETPGDFVALEHVTGPAKPRVRERDEDDARPYEQVGL